MLELSERAVLSFLTLLFGSNTDLSPPSGQPAEIPNWFLDLSHNQVKQPMLDQTCLPHHLHCNVAANPKR